MQTVAIEGTLRTEFGKKAAKAMRKEDLVPCVAYAPNQIIHFTAPTPAFKSLIYTPDFKVAELNINGETYRAILKDSQFHPVDDRLLHLDFLLLVPNHPLTTTIPVRTRGVAPGVKMGGKLLQVSRNLKIKTTPEYLVDHVVVDISALELGKSVRVRDVEANEGVTIMSSPSIPLVTIEIPRALRSAQAAAAKADTKKKK
jgi:large subunit ribosomal protein L25